MPDFGLVPHALLSPSQCVACRTHADPAGFVDLVAELPGFGRVYLCAGCLGMAAGKLGWIEPRVAAELAESLRASEAHGREQALELERANGRGSWSWTPGEGTIPAGSTAAGGAVWHDEKSLSGGVKLEVPAADPTVCECGKPKRATSKSCRSCSAGRALDARKAGATA